MSLSKHKYTPSYDFPQELLSEIFKRLPVKYVLRCRAVQKSWYSLIKTPMFISLHSNYQKLTAHINPKYLLFDNLDTELFTVRFDNAQCQEYCTFDYDLPNSSWYAQSNGLICVSTMFDQHFDFDPDIYLWNPLVQKYRMVPETPLRRYSFEETKWHALAFGFLPEAKDYVVVHMVKPSLTSAPDEPEYPYDESYELYSHLVMISVYSRNSNSWKEMCQEKVFVDRMCTDKSVFVNGTAFWVGYNSNELYQVVMCFDTETNVLRTIRVPNWIEIHGRQILNPRILPFGQSIAYFVEVDQEDVDEDDDENDAPHLDIWVLKDNMMGEFSWVKKMSVGLSENVWARVLGLRNNGEPILAKSNNLISYNLDTHEPYDFVESCDRLTPNYVYEEGSSSPFVISPFVETLLFLDTD
ncbi:hypothetical protein POM88_037888 [Heracleum sosnowskyi]|uniref:F-box domain-containing protein n=1 Tax=Heracleum sosnowskyi TaxID=360622 RepID=A0AAD8HRC3_9APIA|nr:hypothetical protein POM88_037888 [Heracleum sosnowskyi]